ncbi:MAG: hypothetical protein QM696_08665 [Steroidobacteraceae bacterium]
MNFLNNVLGFEAFNAKDMLGKLKKNPERLFLGAADPLSSRMWGKVTGKDYEPLVDQMGGAYGGHTLSVFGNKDGGVYQRARDAGIDTNAGGMMHDAAHIVSAMYGGGYGLDKLGSVMPQNLSFGGSQGGNSPFGSFGNWRPGGINGPLTGDYGSAPMGTGFPMGGGSAPSAQAPAAPQGWLDRAMQGLNTDKGQLGLRILANNRGGASLGQVLGQSALQQQQSQEEA